MTVPSHIAVCGHCPRRIASYSETEPRPTDPRHVLDVVSGIENSPPNKHKHSRPLPFLLPWLCCAPRNRGYSQHWLKTEKEIPNQSAARIFAAATSILKAGH
jgi:hypothetical protein